MPLFKKIKMKNLLSLLSLSLVIVLTSISYGQKPKLVSGDYSAIKGITTWSVSVEVNNPTIHKKPEYVQFLQERVEKMNSEEDELGDEWQKKWEGNFHKKYLNKYCLLMNKYLKKAKSATVTVKKNDETAQGKIVIKPYWIYLGYANPFKVQPAKVSSKIHFLDSDGNELLVVDMVESPGITPFVAPSYSFGFDPEGEFSRINESFAKCGKDLGGFLAKKVYS